MKKILPYLAIFVVFQGCSTEQNNNSVEIVTTFDRKDCIFLGHVSGTSIKSIDNNENLVNTASMHLKYEAAQLGATHVYAQNPSYDNNSIYLKITGSAYKCPN